MSSTAYLKFFNSQPADTMPSRASTNIKTGSWNVKPSATSLHVHAEHGIDARRERDVGIREAREECPRGGKHHVVRDAAPLMNSADEETTNGMASFFSFAYSPGAMNNHTWHMMYGDAINTPVSAAIFNIRKKPSLGR